MRLNTVFESYKNVLEINEAFTYGDAKKILIPLGWNVSYNGKNLKIDKDVAGKHYTTAGHLKHDGGAPERRSIDAEQMDKLREYLVDDFLTNGDMDSFKAIKQIPWDKCGTGHSKIKSPFLNLLKDYDPETGQKKTKEVILTRGQRGAQTRLRNQIAAANEKFKEAILEPLDYSKPEGIQIMADYNELYRKYYYNTCRSPQDRRPLLDFWTSDVKKRGGDICFGRDDMNLCKTKFYVVQPDGSIDKSKPIIETMMVSGGCNLSESQYLQYLDSKR